MFDRANLLNVVLEASLPGALQEPKRLPFSHSRSTADHNDDARVWFLVARLRKSSRLQVRSTQSSLLAAWSTEDTIDRYDGPEVLLNNYNTRVQWCRRKVGSRQRRIEFLRSTLIVNRWTQLKNPRSLVDSDSRKHRWCLETSSCSANALCSPACVRKDCLPRTRASHFHPSLTGKDVGLRDHAGHCIR